MDLAKEIKKSLPKMERLFAKDILLVFADTPADELEEYNFGMGTMIRLKLLRDNSNLYQAFLCQGFANRDAMAMAMIRALHQHLQQKWAKGG